MDVTVPVQPAIVDVGDLSELLPDWCRGEGERLVRPGARRGNPRLGVRRRQSVSAWLAEAARARLRLEALAAAVTAWEQDFGPLTEAEVHDADRVLAQAAQRRRKGVA